MGVQQRFSPSQAASTKAALNWSSGTGPACAMTVAESGGALFESPLHPPSAAPVNKDRLLAMNNVLYNFMG
jgi:hypothetical protein